MKDRLAEAVYRAAEYGTDRPVTFDVPEDAVIRPGSGPSIWDGLTITHWTAD